MDPMTIGLIAQGVGLLGSAAGAVGSAVNVKKGRKEEQRYYDYAKSYLNSDYYRDPTSTAGNRSLIKSMDERMADANEALQNRTIAGGATMENTLAQKQANNRVMSDFYSKLLMNEDERRRRVSSQQLALEQQHSSNIQNQYYQNAQNWQAWGSAFGDAMQSVGNSFLINQG